MIQGSLYGGVHDRKRDIIYTHRTFPMGNGYERERERRKVEKEGQVTLDTFSLFISSFRAKKMIVDVANYKFSLRWLERVRVRVSVGSVAERK